jgi:hypothetical protein
MKPDEIILQVFLWVITVTSAFIAYEFYKSKDGRLRILIIELFIAKVWVYGGSALYYLFMPETTILVKIGLNLPMLIVMLRLYHYIRNKK